MKEKSIIKTAMKPYRHIQKFIAKYCDVDFKDELKPSAYLAFFEEVACSSADELGFGYEYLKPLNYGFIVSAVRCQFIKPVRLSQTFETQTWPLPPTFATFGREYRVCSQEGEVLANASSRWCMVDLASGRVLASKALTGQDYSTYNTERAVDVQSWKIPKFEIEEGELKFQMTVANSEYDHNMHVNNTRYADYCLNCFSLAELSSWRLKRLSITYVRQCKEGDKLSFYRKRDEDGGYLVQGFNGEGETVVQFLLYFAE